MAVVFPRESVRLWDLCAAGELAPARELYAELLPLARLDMTPKLVQYFKAALDELGLGGGPCRPPRLAAHRGRARDSAGRGRASSATGQRSRQRPRQQTA